MELKKDSNAVSIDMLLIVHSEKRRAAHGTHSDRQADPGALPQRRGGNERPARAPRPRHLGLLAWGPPAGGRPTRPRKRPGRPTLSPHRCLLLLLLCKHWRPVPSRGNAQPRDCPGLTPCASVTPREPASSQPLSEGCTTGLEDAWEEGGQNLSPDPWVTEACSSHGTL